MDEPSWQARAEEHERWLARMRPMMDRMAVSILNHEERISQNERMYQELITTLQEIRDRL
jgi:hypothetical protein